MSQSREFSGFLHERMLEGRGICVESGGFDAELPTGLAPVRDWGENFADDRSRLGELEVEARSSGERSGNGGFLVVLTDGRFQSLRAVYFRHGIQVVSR